MFDLESEIQAWRENLARQKVGDGEILDELESHLREQIDRNVKTGMAQADAFMSAVAKIGAVKELKREFRKTSRKHIVIKASLLILGWLAAGFTLSYCICVLALHWNFWNWGPAWDAETMIELSGLVLSVAAFWFLAKFSRDLPSRTGSFLVCGACLVMAVLAAIYWLPPEEARGFLLGRNRPSPLWFRGGIVLLWCIPIVIWLLTLRPRRPLESKRPSPSVAG
jgi:hypothetical protein